MTNDDDERREKHKTRERKMQLRWGIIGTGRICQDFLLALLTCSADEHRIVAVGARSKSQAETFVQEYSLGDHVQIYGTQEDVYRDPNVDIVYIGTIEQVHRNLTVQALEHDKHVLCEKPMAMNEAEVKEMVETAKRKKKFLMEAIWSRFFPIYDHLRRAVKEIGTIKFVDCTFCVPKLASNISSLLMAIGCYPIQAALIAFDHEEPIEVRATGHTGMHQGERTDTMANITLLFKNNRMAVLNCLGEDIEAINSLTIYGDKGVIRLPTHFWCPTSLILPSGERVESPLPETIKPTNYVHSAGLRYEAIACREAILRGAVEHPFITHDQSLQIARILQSAREQILSKSD